MLLSADMSKPFRFRGGMVTVCPEAAISHAKLYFFRRRYKMKITAVVTPVSLHRNSNADTAKAGVALCNHTPSRLSIRSLQHDAKGWLSSEIRLRGRAPIAVIGAYLPHARSPNRAWYSLLLRGIENEYMRLQPLYPAGVFIALDSNTRPRSYKGHATLDEGKRDARGEAFLAFMRRIKVRPLHGRDDAFPATWTSRMIDPTRPGEAEVDFILADKNFTAFTLRPRQPWTSLPGGITHNRLSVLIEPPPEPEAAPTRAQPEEQAPAVKHFVPPAWRDRRHYTAAGMIEEALDGPLGRIINDETAPLQSRVDAAHEVWYGTQQRAYVPTQADVEACDPVGVAGTAAANAAVDVTDAAAAASQDTPPSAHTPSPARGFRNYAGARLPVSVAGALDFAKTYDRSAKKLRKQAQRQAKLLRAAATGRHERTARHQARAQLDAEALTRLHQQLDAEEDKNRADRRRMNSLARAIAKAEVAAGIRSASYGCPVHTDGSTAAGTPSQLLVDAAHQQLLHKRAAKAAQRRAAAYSRICQRDVMPKLERLRRNDPRSMFRVLKAMVNEDTGLVDDDTRKPAEAVPAFMEKGRKVFASEAEEPPALHSRREVLSDIPHTPGPTDWWQPAITSQEVYLGLFPWHSSVLITSCPGGGDVRSCPLCLEYNRRSGDVVEAWSDASDVGPPEYRPRLNALSCAGECGIHGRMMTFPRTESEGDRIRFRLKVCGFLATLFNAIKQAGAVPDSWLVYRTIWLLKYDKEGKRMDAANPDHHRPITIGQTFLKLFGVIIASRMYHWAVSNGVISESQVGFMPYHSTEQHVAVLREAIQFRWRRGLPLYVLFIDFKAAYDSVHPKALWAVLRQRGVPEDLVRLLADWSSRRRTRICVNDQRSEEIPMRMGVGQGDVLSPLLFNIFIESLSDHLHGRCTPVSFCLEAGDKYKHLSVPILDTKYADDVAILATSHAGVQRALNAVQDWCSAWGMALGIGNLKTQAMLFPAPPSNKKGVRAHGREPPPLPPALVQPGTGAHVDFVLEYKYLGYWLRWNLCEKGLVQRLVDALTANWNRYFTSNAYVRHNSPAFALQVFRNVVIGAGNYLLALAAPTKAARQAMDKLSLEVSRRVLNLFDHAPRSLAWAEGKLLTGAGIMARERARLRMTFEWLGSAASPFPRNLAARMYRLIVAEGALRPQRAPVDAPAEVSYSWFWRMQDLERHYSHSRHVQPAVAASPESISVAAAVYGRAVSFDEWAQEAFTDLPEAVHAPGSPLPSHACCHAESRPPVGRPKNVTAWFYQCTRQLAWRDPIPGQVMGSAAHPGGLLGTRKSTTPLSMRGPGCSGAVLAGVTHALPKRLRQLLAGLRLGRLCLFLEPMSMPCDGTPYDECSRTPTCRCCGEDIEDPFHIITTCKAPAVAAARAAVLAGLPRKLRSLARMLERATATRERRCDPSATAQRRKVSGELLTAGPQSEYWATAGGRFVLYRLLAAAPWRAAMATPAHATSTSAILANPLAHALGSLFDLVNVKPHRLRAFYNAWGTWAGAGTNRIMTAWARCATAAAGADAMPDLDPTDTAPVWQRAHTSQDGQHARERAGKAAQGKAVARIPSGAAPPRARPSPGQRNAPGPPTAGNAPRSVTGPPGHAATAGRHGRSNQYGGQRPAPTGPLTDNAALRRPDDRHPVTKFHTSAAATPPIRQTGAIGSLCFPGLDCGPNSGGGTPPQRLQVLLSTFQGVKAPTANKS